MMNIQIQIHTDVFRKILTRTYMRICTQEYFFRILPYHLYLYFLHPLRGHKGKRLAREGIPLEGLQQVQCAVWLLLHKQLGLMDHLSLLPVFPYTCLENEDGQQKEPYLKRSFHLIEKIGFEGEVAESWAEFTSPK